MINTVSIWLRNRRLRVIMALAMTLGLAMSSWGNYASHSAAMLSHAGIVDLVDIDDHHHEHGHHDSAKQIHEHNPLDHTHEILFTLPEFSPHFSPLLTMDNTQVLVPSPRLFPSRLERPPMLILALHA